MHLRYDEDFAEAAVFVCTSGRRKGVPSLHLARFQREREKLYSILDPDERDAAFFRLHLEWFREWGLEKVLTAPLAELPLLSEALDLLAFRKARGHRDEGSELYVAETRRRSGVVALRPERLERASDLDAFLRHELMHLHDMVDPAFGYRPELPARGASPSQQSAASERYRLLWDVSIDGRLTRAGRPAVAAREQRWCEFRAGFPFWNPDRQGEIFDRLWNDPAPTHDMLEKWVCDARQLEPAAGPRPGGRCPLCGFPTFAWAEGASLSPACINAIQSEFPHWEPAQGACGRCAVIYRRRRPEAVLDCEQAS